MPAIRMAAGRGWAATSVVGVAVLSTAPAAAQAATTSAGQSTAPGAEARAPTNATAPSAFEPPVSTAAPVTSAASSVTPASVQGQPAARPAPAEMGAPIGFQPPPASAGGPPESQPPMWSPRTRERSFATFARQGYFVIAAERLAAVYQTKYSFDYSRPVSVAGTPASEHVSGTTSDTSVDFLGVSSSSWDALPRLGFDLFVLDGLSVGMAFVYVSRSGSSDFDVTIPANGSSSTSSTSSNSPSTTAWLVHPRVGYALMLNDNIGFWGRAGFVYVSTVLERQQTQTTTAKTHGSLPFLSIEPLFVFSPIDHFGIVTGPFLDLGLGGSSTTETTNQPNQDESVKETCYGITLGVAGWF